MTNLAYEENEAQSFSLCGHSGCGKLVPYNYDEALCEMHEWEANEDAMDDFLSVARSRPCEVLNRVLGHLAASPIDMGTYLQAGRLIEEAIFQTHLQPKRVILNCDYPYCGEDTYHECEKCGKAFCSDHGSIGGGEEVASPSLCWQHGGFDVDV